LTYNSPNWKAHNLSKSKLDKFIYAVQVDVLIPDDELSTDSVSAILRTVFEIEAETRILPLAFDLSEEAETRTLSLAI